MNKNYHTHKDNPEWKKKWLKKARDYYHAHREEIMKKMKAKRQTTEYKTKMKMYRHKNKNKIFAQEVITKKRYYEKNRDGVTDQYVLNQLRTQKLIDVDYAPTPELIEAKRLQLLIKRQIRNNGNNNANQEHF